MAPAMRDADPLTCGYAMVSMNQIPGCRVKGQVALRMFFQRRLSEQTLTENTLSILDLDAPYGCITSVSLKQIDEPVGGTDMLKVSLSTPQIKTHHVKMNSRLGEFREPNGRNSSEIE